MEQQPELGTCDVVWHSLWLQALASLKYHARLNQTYNMVNNYVNRSGATATRSFSCTGWIVGVLCNKSQILCVWNMKWDQRTRPDFWMQGRMGCIAEILCFGRHCILLYCSRSRLEAQKSARLLGNVHKPGIDQKKSHCTFGIGPDVLQICPVWSAIKSGRLLKAVPSLQVMGPFAPRPLVRSGYFWNLLDLSVLHHMVTIWINMIKYCN